MPKAYRKTLETAALTDTMSNLDPACDIEVQGQRLHARADCTRLLDLGAPMKKAHDRVIRLAPRLAIEPNEIDWLVDHVGTAE